jgi:hypothetical protein
VTYRPVLAIGLSPIAVLVYHQYRYWCKTGKWQKLMAIVTVDYDSEWLFIDGMWSKPISTVQVQPVVVMKL